MAVAFDIGHMLSLSSTNITPSLTVHDIRHSDLKHSFINVVIKSLQVLLDEAGIAHLNIRIENLCWDNRQHAVFIDFNRSADKNKSTHECIGGKYGGS